MSRALTGTWLSRPSSNAGRPALSARRIRTYFPSAFNSSLSGLLGNDGGGAMGSFILFALLGLFPVAGQNVYLITPSFFREVNITNPVTGKTATVRNANFDPAAHANIYYVQNATLNGKPYTKSWIGHEFFSGVYTLELTLGANESAWGTKPEDRPPSYLATSEGD